MNTMNEQHELYENARTRVKQKKRLYFHFILFLIGSIFFFSINKVFKVGETYMENWYEWAIIIWFFFFVFHFINVFITNRFMGNEWERKQTEKLILKQELKIAKLEKEIANETRLKTESEQRTSEVTKKDNSQKNSE